MNRKRILCVSYGGGHAAMLSPVIKELEKNCNIEVITLGLTTSKQYFESKGISCLGFKDFTYLVDGDFYEVGHSLVDKEHASSVVSQEESIAYMGINMLELRETEGVKKANSDFNRIGRQAFLPVDFFTKLVKHLDIDLVLSTNSPRSERAAIMAARRAEVKSICLVDLFAPHEYKWLKDNTYADVVCVLNEEVKEFLVSHGRSEQDIVVTGNPAFDSIFHHEKIEVGNKLRQALRRDETIILYASQVEPEIHPFIDLEGDTKLPEKIEMELRQFIRENSDFKLLVRHHPSENRDFVVEERVEYAGGDLHSILHAVDIVVVITSTVAVEAYIAGKPVISVDLSVFTQDAPFSSMGISSGVQAISELSSKINELMLVECRDFKMEPALEKVIFEIDKLLN